MLKGQSTKTARQCLVCGKTFLIHPRHIKLGGGKMCSPACRNRHRTIPLEERFFRYVGSITAAGCILWKGLTNADGYGVIGSGIRPWRNLIASRVSYELFVAIIPDGLSVLHHCDNPPCINPAHLFLGTTADNAADKVAKGRQLRGESLAWSRLTEERVREIRERHKAGDVTFRQLAELYGISFNAIRCAIRRHTWRHVD